MLQRNSSDNLRLEVVRPPKAGNGVRPSSVRLPRRSVDRWRLQTWRVLRAGGKKCLSWPPGPIESWPAPEVQRLGIIECVGLAGESWRVPHRLLELPRAFRSAHGALDDVAGRRAGRHRPGLRRQPVRRRGEPSPLGCRQRASRRRKNPLPAFS